MAQTYDTGPYRNAVTTPGVTNELLYTDATVALDPDTGRLVWHYQHQPNDQWDLDWAFERVLFTLPGNPKTLVATAGKQAIYDVLEAEHGLEALKIVESFQSPIHLLLTDIVMPHMNGRDLAEQISSVRPATKVLFMSGYTDHAAVHRELSAGAPFLQKPFTPDALAKKVRGLLDSVPPAS